ncbi:CDP-glucose 4,6-dehydratase [Methylocaldum sp.]|uniref:CDP-glucose 4,6-dehydratase n=1 Tax=Methylocaldum sp. TaxID=1969727 RepID=UPI00321F6EB0
MPAAFWRDRQVFVTGHTGFKGGWLSLWLEALGARVTGYSLDPPTNPSLFELAQVGSGIRSIIADIRDSARLVSAIADADPEVIFHLAAQPLVRASYDSPVETFMTNVLGTVHLLEAARACRSVKSIVVVTSDKCYENREWVWPYRENEAMGGYDPYSASKGCAELATTAYRRSFFLGQDGGERVGIGSARAGNVIGGGDWAVDRLVPDIVRSAAQRKPVRIRNPRAVRPWQHVLEPLWGYLILAEKLAVDPRSASGGWNFGPWDSDTQPVEWVTRTIVDLWGDGASWELDEGHQVHEAHLLKLDSSKARAGLGWQPRLNLAEALAWTVNWYKAHAAARNMRAETLKQIRQYEDLTHNDQ